MAGVLTDADANVAAGFERLLESTGGGLQDKDGNFLHAPETTPATPPEEVREETTAAEETAEVAEDESDAETSDEEVAAAAEGEEELDAGQVIDTWDELAQSFEVDPQDLLSHMTVPDAQGNAVSLADVVEAYNDPASTHLEEQVQARVETIRAASDTAMQELTAATAQVIARVQQHRAPDGGWDALRQSDPAEYIRQREMQDSDRRSAQDALDLMDRETARREGEDSSAKEQYLQQQAKLTYQLMPGWRDPNAGRAAQQEIHDYLVRSGFSKDQIEVLDDARSIVTVWKAAQWDRAQKAKPLRLKRLKGLPTKHVGATARDDTPRANAQQKEHNAALKKFEKSGNLEDALSLFEEHVR